MRSFRDPTDRYGEFFASEDLDAMDVLPYRPVLNAAQQLTWASPRSEYYGLESPIGRTPYGSLAPGAQSFVNQAMLSRPVTAAPVLGIFGDNTVVPTHLSGPSLCGFYGLFEGDYGDENTPTPYVTVSPSFVGESMLPFSCPRCHYQMQELACPKSREKYRDSRQGRRNHFCPKCGFRFFLDECGGPLSTPLAAKALVGPSLIIYPDGRRQWQDKPSFFARFLALFGG